MRFFFSFLGKGINQLLFVRMGIVGVLTNILAPWHKVTNLNTKQLLAEVEHDIMNDQNRGLCSDTSSIIQ